MDNKWISFLGAALKVIRPALKALWDGYKDDKHIDETEVAAAICAALETVDMGKVSDETIEHIALGLAGLGYDLTGIDRPKFRIAASMPGPRLQG